MKILLLVPNSKEVRVTIPLGLLYISAALRGKGFSDLKLVDARQKKLGREEISRHIKSFSPDVVGISGLSIEASEVHALARLVKETGKECKVVIGGPYAFSSPESIIKDKNIDFVIIGEGERTFLELLEALERRGEISGIDGLAFKNQNGPVINFPSTMIEDLDSIAFPAWDLLDMKEYFNTKSHHSSDSVPMSNRIAPIFTSRGCPYDCIYCHHIFGKKIRFRSAQNVIKEIEFLIAKYGIEEIEVADDCFNLDLARAKQICDEIIKRGIRINLSFPTALRADAVDEELIDKLKRAGAHMICYAIESASLHIQQRIKKNLDLSKARHIVQYTVKKGITTAGFFMLGFPGETREEMLQTVKFALDTPFHLMHIFYVTPLPRTPLFDELVKNNVVLSKATIYHYHRLTFNASSVPDVELKRIRKLAYIKFYFRPSQMWRLYKKVPNKRLLIRNAFEIIKRSCTA